MVARVRPPKRRGRPYNAKSHKTMQYLNMTAKEIRIQAAKTGELPHVLLLRVSRGERINGVMPDLEMRIDAAIKAAPFFAPKLNSVHVTNEERPTQTNVVFLDPYMLSQMSESELHVLRKYFGNAQPGLQSGDGAGGGRTAIEGNAERYQTTIDCDSEEVAS